MSADRTPWPASSPPDWQLPPGVPRSLWDYAHDVEIARSEDQFLAEESLLQFDRDFVRQAVPDRPGRAIDLGCGTGRFCRELSDLGWDVAGVDLSPEALRVARAACSDTCGRTQFFRGNLCALDWLPDATFDVGLCLFGTLGMILGPQARQAALQHARRVLKSGAPLLIHVHNRWRHFYHPQGRRWLLRDSVRQLSRSKTAGDTWHDYRQIPGVYHHVFSRSEILRLLRRTGFEPRSILPIHPDGNRSLSGAAWLVDWRATGWLIHAIAT